MGYQIYKKRKIDGEWGLLEKVEIVKTRQEAQNCCYSITSKGNGDVWSWWGVENSVGKPCEPTKHDWIFLLSVVDNITDRITRDVYKWCQICGSLSSSVESDFGVKGGTITPECLRDRSSNV